MPFSRRSSIIGNKDHSVKPILSTLKQRSEPVQQRPRIVPILDGPLLSVGIKKQIATPEVVQEDIVPQELPLLDPNNNQLGPEPLQNFGNYYADNNGNWYIPGFFNNPIPWFYRSDQANFNTAGMFNQYYSNYPPVSGFNNPVDTLNYPSPQDSSSNLNTIEYVEISTLGNALDFGDLRTATRGMGASGNPTRGIFAGGIVSSNTTDISFVTISSKGNSVKFGDLTSARRMDGGGQVSDSVRGLFWNANFDGSGGDGLDYINIASEGNAVFFTDGLTTTDDVACSSNRTRGVFASGYKQPGGPATNIIQFVTISTTGQISDFGDMSIERFSAGGCSDSHGGLGGF